MKTNVFAMNKRNKVTNFSLMQGIYSCGVAEKFSLGTTALLVIIGLASHYNADKNIVFPSQAYLAGKLNISERSVIRAIKELLSSNLIMKSKNGAANIYCFTNIFFEAVGLSAERCQIVTNEDDKLSYKHDKYNNKNNSVLNLRESSPYISVEESKRYLDEQRAIKRGSPLDMEYEQALDYLKNLPKFLEESYFAKALREKWGLNQGDY